MEFKVWDEKRVKLTEISTGIIGSLPNFEIRCNLEKDQLSNKNKIAKMIYILRREGLINE